MLFIAHPLRSPMVYSVSVTQFLLVFIRLKNAHNLNERKSYLFHTQYTLTIHLHICTYINDAYCHIVSNQWNEMKYTQESRTITHSGRKKINKYKYLSTFRSSCLCVFVFGKQCTRKQIHAHKIHQKRLIAFLCVALRFFD